MIKRRHLIALVIAGLPALAAAQAQNRPPDPMPPISDRLTLEKYLDLETVAGPRLSPDGKQIIYTRGWIDKVNDRRESSVWIMNVDGSRNRFLVKGSNATWSPTGDRIAYTADGEPRGSQIWVRWMDAEGATSQVSRLDSAPSAIEWSPNGEWLAFSMQLEDLTNWPIRLPRAPTGAKWTETPRIVERLNYRRDGSGFTDTGYRHLFVVPAGGGSARQLTAGPWDHNNPRWTPDGKSLLFAGNRAEDAEHQWRESDIYAVDVASASGSKVRQLTTRKGPDSGPVPSPDGKRIAYTGYDWTKNTWIDQRLYVMNADGSNPQLVSGDWDRSPSNITWKPDNSGVYFTAQSEGAQNLYYLALSGAGANRVTPVTRGTHMLAVSDIGAGGAAVGTLTTPDRPGDVVRLDLPSTGAGQAPTTFTQLTDVNADILAGVKLGKLTEMWYTAPDGLKVQGWYITPPDFDPSKQYPMQLHIHGGPHSMYGVGFNYAWQEHAANGYVILYTNPRGSTGYGSEFGNMIMRAYPSKDYDDLMSGVDALLKKGFVDERNMFVTGCSGGGVLTAWIVGKTDRFAAASANCPVVDWFSFVGTTDGASWYYNFEKLPWEDPSEHLRRSPLMYVGNVKTPTMLMTGVNDLRTPMPQTEQFYSALKLRKVPTAMVRFNEEWHGTSSKPSNFMRTQLYLRYWFDRHKRTPAAATNQQ